MFRDERWGTFGHPSGPPCDVGAPPRPVLRDDWATCVTARWKELNLGNPTSSPVSNKFQSGNIWKSYKMAPRTEREGEI